MRTLIVKGKKFTAATIRTGESAQERYAAAELAKYLSKVGIPAGDGLTFDVRCDAAVPRDGYVIRPEEDGTLTIRGGGGRGVIYGAYGFLTHYAGMRFFMPGLEKLGEGDITVGEEYAFTPVIECRQSDWQCGNSDVDWCVKNGINARPIPEEMGGYFWCADGLGGHTMERLAGAKQYEEQPCLSDPEVLARVIKNVRAALEKDPKAGMVSVSQNDNGNYCKCPKCAAVDAEEESHAGTMLRFVNAVADDIAKDYPNVVVDTFAYQYTRKAPKITKASPNVSVRICSIECSFAHPLADDTCALNAEFVRDITDWSKVCRRIRVWDYVTDFCRYIPPYPNFHVLRENMRFFADHGAYGMYPEGNYTSPKSGEFGELRCYLLAQLMMDPYMSATDYYALMDEFLAAYYGAGWRYLRAFIDWTCGEAAGCERMSCWEEPFSIIPAAAYLAMEDTIDGWWDKAEELAGDRAEFVRRSRLQWRYIKLMLHPDPEEGKRFMETLEKEKVQMTEWWGNDWTRIHDDLKESFPQKEDA
jgi:hypothetical protein